MDNRNINVTEIVILLLLIDYCASIREATFSRRFIPENGNLNASELAVKYGYPSKEYFVTTADGYVINLTHLPGESLTPVLCITGLADSGASFFMRGNTSIGIILAQARYDVWVLDVRGNIYTRRHTTLDPDKDAEFWNFSVHEMAIYDLPAAIDFVLNKTNADNVNLIGYSQGNTVFYVMGSEKPEYNLKVNVAIALSPIAFLFNSRYLGRAIIDNADLINEFLIGAGIHEIFGEKSIEKFIFECVCTNKRFGYNICMKGIVLPIVGVGSLQLGQDFFPTWVGHYPAGTSRKTIHHLTQIGNSKKFGQYDYGSEKNKIEYKSKAPPEYDLSKVTMRIALICGRNDYLSQLTDVQILRKKLPNIVEYFIIKDPQFNHADFLWGERAYEYAYPKVLKVLETYN